MPKKAVAAFLLLGLLGAAIFVYFTFPRNRSEIPASNNQRPFPSSPGPNGVPEPAPTPRPTVPHGPTLRVMAWGSAAETRQLQTLADAFTTRTGQGVSLTIDGDVATYRSDLRQALDSARPPDVCLIAARDFSGIDPARDLADVTSDPAAAPRTLQAFTVVGRVKAVPDEFSVDLLFYNPHYFDVAGFGYPDRHWNWDILEAITRGLVALKIHDATGDPVYPLEMAPDFDLWNVFCTQAGHAALDLDDWHLADTGSRDAHVRALDFIHELFQGLNVTAPPPKGGQPAGRYFGAQRAALLLAPSESAAGWQGNFWKVTFPPADLTRASVARVNGWAVTAGSTQPAAARELASFLARQPVHAGWLTARPSAAPSPEGRIGAVAYETLEQSLLPRLSNHTSALAHYLDEQIDRMARNPEQKAEPLYAQISLQYKSGFNTPTIEGGLPQPVHAAGPKMLAAPAIELRGP